MTSSLNILLRHSRPQQKQMPGQGQGTSAGWSRLILAVLATSFTSLPTFLTMEAMRAWAYSMYTAVLPLRFSISSKLNLRRKSWHSCTSS